MNIDFTKSSFKDFINKNYLAGKMLLKHGIYTNPIMYPAVSLKDARVRMSIMATHTKEHLDKALDAFEFVSKKLNLAPPSAQ